MIVVTSMVAMALLFPTARIMGKRTSSGRDARSTTAPRNFLRERVHWTICMPARVVISQCDRRSEGANRSSDTSEKGERRGVG
jgi:hypothetical protein